jgi:hypothetical protein
MLGGYYLLEDGSGRYLLEDSSGAYLIDAYVPQLGDPVTFTSPSWSGRVVSVQREDIMTIRSNYDLVTVSASNSAVAVVGTGAILSDGGSYYSLEDGSGRYLLEDSSGFYLLDSFTYRNLSVRVNQNQDGTTTTYGSLETFQSGYSAGQTFLLVSGNLGLGQNYTITNVRTSFEGAGTGVIPVYTIEFGDAYTGFTLQGAGGGVLTRTAAQATQALGVAMPGGVLGKASVTATQGTFTAETDITGLAVTVTVGSGRSIVVTAQMAANSSVANDSVEIRLYEDATQIAAAQFIVLTSATAQVAKEVACPVRSPTAGVHTYKATMRRVVGTGNITMYADAVGSPAWIKVEDVGV